MKRTKRIDATLPLWRKLTGGSLRCASGRKIKPKEEIRISAEELGKFVNQFKLLEDGSGSNKIPEDDKPSTKDRLGRDIKKEEEEAPVPENEEYFIDHVASGWFNVVSGSGKVMNESKLRSEDAEKLKASLEEVTTEE